MHDFTGLRSYEVEGKDLEVAYIVLLIQSFQNMHGHFGLLIIEPLPQLYLIRTEVVVDCILKNVVHNWEGPLRCILLVTFPRGSVAFLGMAKVSLEIRENPVHQLIAANRFMEHIHFINSHYL